MSILELLVVSAGFFLFLLCLMLVIVVANPGPRMSEKERKIIKEDLRKIKNHVNEEE